MAVPAQMEVDEIPRKMPEGKLTTINEIRRALAIKHKATTGYPITTDIFACIAANTVEGQRLLLEVVEYKGLLKKAKCIAHITKIHWQRYKTCGFSYVMNFSTMLYRKLVPNTRFCIDIRSSTP